MGTEGFTNNLKWRPFPLDTYSPRQISRLANDCSQAPLRCLPKSIPELETAMQLISQLEKEISQLAHLFPKKDLSKMCRA